MAVMPSISSTLAVLLPTTLPMAKSGEPLRADITLTVNSGAEVPKATIVSPITKGEILSLAASDEAPRTKPSAPPIKMTKPTTTARVSISFYYDIKII